MSFWDKAVKGVFEASNKASSSGTTAKESAPNILKTDAPLYDKAPSKQNELKQDKQQKPVAQKIPPQKTKRPNEIAAETSVPTQVRENSATQAVSIHDRESKIDRSRLDSLYAGLPEVSPDKLLDEGGVLDPENWWLVGDTEEDKARKAEQAQYRAENPMEDDAMDDQVTGTRYLGKYNQYFEDNGGIDDTYESAWSSFLSGLSGGGVSQGMSRNGTDTFQVSGDMAKSMPGVIKKIADEAIDDGTNRRENRKAMMISGEEYVRQREAGFPGRPIDQIDPNSVYSKLEEMDNWNYVPYIEDEDQRRLWDFQQLGNNTSNFFKELADVRDDWTDGTLDYNGQPLSKKQLDRRLADYITGTYDEIGSLEQGTDAYNEVFVPTSDKNDPRVQDFAIPMKHVYTFGTGTDAEEVSGRGEFHAQMTGNGEEIAVWFGDDTDNAWIFDDEEDMNANLVIDVVPTSEDDGQIDTYANIEPLTYTQYDGTEVSVPYYDAIKMGNGEYNVDYGPFNIGKPASEVADLSEWKFEEWTPKIVDMFTGSVPLFFNQTAWPMAVGNAVTSSQGLDPQSYDQSTGAYKRMAEDITADQLALSTVLSLGMPLTERLAGNLGSAPLSKLTSKAVDKAGLSPLMNYPIEAIAGEGVEEIIAGSWEEVQSMGLDEAFGNPMLDEDGNPMYDSTGHAIKDPNTPIDQRFANYRETWLENFLGGATLGSAMTVPQVINDKRTNSGYIGQHNARKSMREAEKEYGLPRYRVAKKGNKEFVITPEILEQYKRED